MHIRSRRRSVRFDGRTITISIAIKDKLGLPDDRKHRFPARKITRIKHVEPTTWKDGWVTFVAPGLPDDVVTNVPAFVPREPANVFRYAADKKTEVAELLEAIEKARG
ncbi:hypothetical protein [Amycolatopsis samaneae]|uniref:Uncharacterized protein n=1 Tax=Amycolatopsis samaneae TaxID=664691 RepID=A0ABW5GSN9_9PSEU